MKKIRYIALIILMISCKNETAKAELNDMESTSKAIEETISDEALTDISTQKFNEYIDLIKLKRAHPEFKKDINAQLLSFTTDSLSVRYYPEGFQISDIQQSGTPRVESDSTMLYVLRYTVSTETMSFKDSVLAKVSSKSGYSENGVLFLKKVTFLKFD